MQTYANILIMSLVNAGTSQERKPVKKKSKAKNNRPQRSADKPALGRPGVDRTLTLQTADQFRTMLPEAWPRLSPALLAARSPEDVTKAFESCGLLSTSFVPHWSGLILETVQDRRFPRVRAKAQIEFLSDSLGAQGKVTPRRSREICAEQRTIEEAKTRHVIVRRDFYIECTCRYKGPALRRACPKCGTMQLAEGLLLENEDDLA